MGYSKEQLMDRIRVAARDMSTFYKSDFINYRGVTTDTKEYYTEVIAEWLLSDMEVFNGIPTILREKGYYTSSHDGIPDKPDSNRKEEIIAMNMFRQGTLGGRGKIIDYQTPLKNRRSDTAGKIDLLSYEDKILHILELKEPESKESMLRCVLEGYTYLKTVHHETLLKSFGLSSDTTIKTSPLVAMDGDQHQELKEGRPMLLRLMKALGIEPLYYYEKNKKYYIMEKKTNE